jgi:hypothetical protein
MCGIQRVGNLHSDVQQQLHRQRLAADPMLQRLAIQELHRDKALPIALINLVNCADARVVQRRGRASFPAESLQRRGILGNFGRKKL